MSFLEFQEIIPPKPRKNKIFRVHNIKLDEDIGVIGWDCGWRKYVYITPDYSMRYCQFCLVEIAEFVEKLNEEHKNER